MTRDELIERAARETQARFLMSSLPMDFATRIVDLLSPVLEWSGELAPDSTCSYNHAQTTDYDPYEHTGYRIEWKGWKDSDSRVLSDGCGFFVKACDTLEAAQAAATAHATAEWIATTKAAKEQAND